jgi:hypothetical protein
MLSMLMNREWLKSKGKPNSSSSKGRIMFRIMNYHFNTPLSHYESFTVSVDSAMLLFEGELAFNKIDEISKKYYKNLELKDRGTRKKERT